MPKEDTEPVVGAGRRSDGDLTPIDVTQQLSLMARELRAEPTQAELLQGIVDAALSNVPGADYSGITLVSKKGQITTPVITDETVCVIDRLQLKSGQGPCLSSARRHLTVRSDDLRTEVRWPLFSPEAARAGVLSILSVQLFMADDTLGALSVYSRQADVFDVEAEDIALALAAHAAVAMVGVDKEDHLRVAVASRDIIGQAKGILMERHKIGSTAAFRLLVRASQENNRRLSVIAEMIVVTGQEPTRENVQEF